MFAGHGRLPEVPLPPDPTHPGGRTLTRAGVLAGLAAGRVTLYVTLVVMPHPLGMHGGIWGLLMNRLTALVISTFTARPSAETVRRVHGEVERFIYGTEGAR